MFRKLLGINPAPQLLTYRGFGSESSVVVIGRVTQTFGTGSTASYSQFSYAKKLIQSYLARPLENVSVMVSFAGTVIETKTNEAGIFRAELLPTTLKHTPSTEWYTASVNLPDYPEVPVTQAEVLIEGLNNTYGIISDIDDTVLISNATRKIKLLFSTLFKTPENRTPFVAVNILYNAFMRGFESISSNPIFYVSSSHWNLYEFLSSFFSLNNLPKGPFLLKENAGIRAAITSTGEHNQKYTAIEAILHAYPDLNFVLLGDSGQKDAQIYTEVATNFPGRILVIYIRDVTKTIDTHVDVAKETLAGKVPVVSARTSLEMAVHAHSLKLISQESVDQVAVEIPTA